MISVDIKKDFGNFKLCVKFTSQDEILGLLGASGSGKSLTLKCIAGIERPDEGRIVLNDRVLFDSEKKINIRPQDRKVGYLFQDYALFPNMNILENIKMGIREKVNSKEKDLMAKELIEEMGLKGLEANMPYEISGGEKQRVALARILINKPEILLLDEPFSALDEYLKWKIELNLKDLIDRHKLPSILVSHNKDEIYRTCDSICVMKNGKSEDKQDTRSLFERPKTFSAALISGCKNFSYIEKLSENRVFAKNWGIELEVGNLSDQDLIGARADKLYLEEGPGENSFKLNLVKVIEDVYFNILIVRPPVPLGDFGNLTLSVSKDEWKSLQNKCNLYVKIKKENIMLLKLEG